METAGHNRDHRSQIQRQKILSRQTAPQGVKANPRPEILRSPAQRTRQNGFIPIAFSGREAGCRIEMLNN
jgi:hypothetical protein